VTKEPTILYCVGATKAGTSWLYDYLTGHQECHMRSIKELHYFDTLEGGYFRYQIRRQQQAAAKLREQMLNAKAPRVPHITSKLRDVLDWHNVLESKSEDTAGYLSYLMDGRENHALVADITPSYALLPVERLQRMASLSPDTRFLYLMRDPVARLWSHVRMVARRASDAADAVPEACYATLERVLNGAQSGMTERGDYAGALGRLTAAIAPAKLMVMFMEDMLTPAGLSRLCRFLGIGYVEAQFDRAVHVGPALVMMPEQLQRARALLRPQYEFVARQYPELPANWRKNMCEGTL
jgi:hypothetical protein